MVVTEVWIGVSLGGERTSHGARMGGGDVPESCPVEAKSIYLPPNWRGTMGPATEPPNAWRCAAAVAMVLLGLTSLLSISPEASAAGPTLTIVSPTDRAIIGNGSPVYVVYEVSSFNLTPPGGGPDPNGGHTLIFVDGALTLETAAQTVPLNLPSGGHVIELRLVSTNGSSLVPDVSASISVTVTQGPATGTPRIEIRYVEITFPTPKLVLGRDVTVSFQITDFALVPPVRGEPAPNEGHIEAYLDGVHYSSVTAFRPIPFSDLPDGDHTVTLRLVDNAGTPLTPDASDSVTFRIQFAPIVDINPYLSVIQIILAAAILIVLFYRDWGRSILDRLVARIRGRNA